MQSSDRQVEAGAGATGVELFAPLLCLVGFGLSAYLTAMHYAMMWGDLTLGHVCGGAAGHDCNSVIASRYGSVLGMPVSLLGASFYLCVGVLSLGIVLMRRADACAFVRALLWLCIAAVLVDAYLAWAMWFQLRAFCMLCVATYVVNVLLLTVAALSWRKLRGGKEPSTLLPSMATILKPSESAYYREVLKLYLYGAAGTSIVIVWLVALLLSAAVQQSKEEQLASLLSYMQEFEPIDIPTDGAPSQGPADAEITIAVFSDLLCEQCRVANEYLNIVQANHRSSVRVVYFHFPMDAACNPYMPDHQTTGSCEMTRAAMCAADQHRFWEFHDAVYGDSRRAATEFLLEYAVRAGLDEQSLTHCMEERPLDSVAGSDIELAHAVGVTATPTMFINGRPVVGALEPWMLEEVLALVRTLPAQAEARTTTD